MKRENNAVVVIVGVFVVMAAMCSSAHAVPLPFWVCVKTKINTALPGQPPDYKTQLVKEGYADEGPALDRAGAISAGGLNWTDQRGRKHFTRADHIDNVYVEAFDYTTGQVCAEPASLGASPRR